MFTPISESYLGVVNTQAILFLNSMSERGGILKTFLRADNKCGANCVQLDIKFKIDFKSSGVIENEHKAVNILTTFKITF